MPVSVATLHLQIEWYTPPHTKIDIHTGNLNGFSVGDIANQSIRVEVRKDAVIRVARLEMLVLMKHRARLVSDVQALVKIKYGSIDWNYLERISKDPVEFQEIRNGARAFGLLKP